MSEKVFKVTLTTGKVVHLREMTVKLKNDCVAAACNALGNDAAGPVFQSRLQDEMVKALLVKVGNQVPSSSDREDLDKLFSIKEYNEINKATTEIMGVEDKEKKPKIELVTQSD